MKKIKVMHFVSGLVSGGVEQMLCNYCEELSNSENYEFIVVYQHEAVNSCKEKIEDAGCRVKRITARSESFIKNIVESYLIIRKAGCSSCTYESDEFLCLVCSKMRWNKD